MKQASEEKPCATSTINWQRLEEIKDRLLYLRRVAPKNYGERNKIWDEENELWQEEYELSRHFNHHQLQQWISWRNVWVPLVDRFFDEPDEIEEQAMIPAQDWLKDPQNRANLLKVLRDALLGYKAVPKAKLDTRQQRRGEWVTQFRRSFLHLLGTRKTWRHRTIIISTAHIFEELSSTSFWYDAGIVAEYPGVENLLSSQIKLLMEQIMEETDNELDPQISLQKIDNLMLMMQDCINTMNSQAKNLAAETHTFNAYMEK